MRRYPPFASAAIASQAAFAAALLRLGFSATSSPLFHELALDDLLDVAVRIARGHVLRHRAHGRRASGERQCEVPHQPLGALGRALAGARELAQALGERSAICLGLAPQLLAPRLRLGLALLRCIANRRRRRAGSPGPRAGVRTWWSSWASVRAAADRAARAARPRADGRARTGPRS